MCPVPEPQPLHAAEPIIDLNDPTPQAVHVPPLGPVYPILQRQLLSTVDPATDCEFVGQFAHVEVTAAPVAAEYVPAPHAMHAVSAAAPAVVRYLPAPQLVHVLTKVAPVAVEYLPAAQSVHAAEPIASLYFPATQTAHVPPFGPEYPRLQRQAETAVCPEADVTEYAGQV